MSHKYPFPAQITEGRVFVVWPTTQYTVLPTDYIIEVDTSTDMEILLPAIANAGSGRTIEIRDATGAMNHSFAIGFITITPDGAETINSAPNYTMASTWGTVVLYNNGTEWEIIQAFSQLFWGRRVGNDYMEFGTLGQPAGSTWNATGIDFQTGDGGDSTGVGNGTSGGDWGISAMGRGGHAETGNGGDAGSLYFYGDNGGNSTVAGSGGYGTFFEWYAGNGGNATGGGNNAGPGGGFYWYLGAGGSGAGGATTGSSGTFEITSAKNGPNAGQSLQVAVNDFGLSLKDQVISVAAGGVDATAINGSLIRLTITGLNAAAGTTQTVTLSDCNYAQAGAATKVFATLESYTGTFGGDGIPVVGSAAITGAETLVVTIVNAAPLLALNGNAVVNILLVQ